MVGHLIGCNLYLYLYLCSPSSGDFGAGCSIGASSDGSQHWGNLGACWPWLPPLLHSNVSSMLTHCVQRRPSSAAMVRRQRSRICQGGQQGCPAHRGSGFAHHHHYLFPADAGVPCPLPTKGCGPWVPTFSQLAFLDSPADALSWFCLFATILEIQAEEHIVDT